ncbi:MAG: hypothetical protein LBC25_02460, partial [Holosporales bacterium]|nr:hypothetical protein [Holosporales bacterium]
MFSGSVGSFSFFKNEKETATSEASPRNVTPSEDATKATEASKLQEKGDAGKAKKSDITGKPSDPKDKGRVVVKFVDGSVITEDKVKEEVDNIP